MNDDDSKPGDWPEDFPLEDGNYLNQCLNCGAIFTGLRGRCVCKKCANQPHRDRRQESND